MSYRISPLDYGRSYVLSDELFGFNLGVESIPNYVNGLDVGNALISLSKAIWIIDDKGPLDREVQRFLSSQYLTKARISTANTLLEDPSRALYFLAQFLTLMKFVVLHSKRNDPPRGITKRDVITLGTALHAATDLISRESVRIRRSIKLEDRLQSVVLQLALGEHLMKSRRPLNDVIRSKLMYVHIHSLVRKSPPPNYVEIDDIFAEATGVSINRYLEVGLGFIFNLLRYRGLSRFLPEDEDFILFHPLSWFEKSKIGKEELTKIIDVVSIPLEGFADSIRGQSNREMGYDFLLMKNKPLIRLNRNALLPISYEYVVEKFTTGVFWIIFDYLLRERTNEIHLRFSEYNGFLFEQYVADIAKTIHMRNELDDSSFFADAVYMKSGDEFRTSDAVLVGDDYLILIEATASRITAKRTLAMGIADAFHHDCEKVVWKKAEELNRFINDILEGSVVINDKPIPMKDKIYPVIVTIEGFPKIPPIDDFLFREIDKRGILKQSVSAPLAILTIDDLEDVVIDNQLHLVDALTRWQSDPRYRYLTLAQYLSANQELLSGEESKWYSDNLKATMNEASVTIFGKSFDEIIAENEMQNSV